MGPRSPGIGLQGATSRLDTGHLGGRIASCQLAAGSPAESEPGSAAKRLLTPAAHFQGLPTSYGQAGPKEAPRCPARQRCLREDALRGEGGEKQTASISPSPAQVWPGASQWPALALDVSSVPLQVRCGQVLGPTPTPGNCDPPPPPPPHTHPGSV